MYNKRVKVKINKFKYTVKEVFKLFAILFILCILSIGHSNADDYATDTYTDDIYMDSIRVTEAGVVSAHAVQAIYNTYENNLEDIEPCESSTTYYMHKCDGAQAIVKYYNGEPTQYAVVDDDGTTHDFTSFDCGESELGTYAIN